MGIPEHPAGPVHRERIAPLLIIGAGLCGLGTAIKLREAGIDDFEILERADEVGGTWRDNTYPGVACDVPSNLYSLSFAPNPDWSRAYSAAAEIQAYILKLVDDFRLRPRIRFGINVTGMQFIEDGGYWEIATENSGRLKARIVVLASGPLARGSFPDIPGIERYRGHKVHSAHWDHDYDFRGKRVAVIGTGASAVQIVPELVAQVDHLKVFQRTPPWVLPKADFHTSPSIRRLFREHPFSQRLVRSGLATVHELMALGIVWNTPFTRMLESLAMLHLDKQVPDTRLRRKLTPDYRIGCKRIIISSDYYPALQQDNCELVTTPLVAIRDNGIVTADGLEHHFDAIVFATGYEVCKDHWPWPITGLGGLTLDEAFHPHAQAYKSTAVSGFPNLFSIPGPNGGPGHQSFLVYAEAQMGYVVQAVKALQRRPGCYISVRREVQDRYNAKLQRRMQHTTWTSGCQSWYLTKDGYNATLFPGLAIEFISNLRRFRLQDYELVRLPGAVAARGPADPLSLRSFMRRFQLTETI